MKNDIVEDAAADMEETETTGNFRFMHEKVNHLLKVRGSTKQSYAKLPN